MGSVRALLGGRATCSGSVRASVSPYTHLSLPPAHYDGTEPWETELEELIPLLKMFCQGSGR